MTVDKAGTLRYARWSDGAQSIRRPGALVEVMSTVPDPRIEVARLADWRLGPSHQLLRVWDHPRDVILQCPA